MAKPIRHEGRWRIRWTDEHGRRHSKTFLEQRAARVALQQKRLEVAERKAGLRAPELPDRSFDDAADYWVRNRALQKRSFGDDLSMLKQLRPVFGKIALNDSGALVVAADRYKALKVGYGLDPKTVNNHLTLVISILRLAYDLGWMQRLPKIKKPRSARNSQHYRYLRSDEEFRRFLDAAKREGAMAHMLYFVALYTGMRAGELAGLEWSDVDFETRLITVQRSFDGPTKSGEVRFVPILDALLKPLREWKLRHPGRLVFTNRDGRALGRSGRLFQEVFQRVLVDAGFPKITRKGKSRNYIVFHDLRHSFASMWMAKGGDLFRLSRILGHSNVTVTQIYAHLAPSAFEGDYDRFPAVAEPSGQLLHLDRRREAAE